MNHTAKVLEELKRRLDLLGKSDKLDRERMLGMWLNKHLELVVALLESGADYGEY